MDASRSSLLTFNLIGICKRKPLVENIKTFSVVIGKPCSVHYISMPVSGIHFLLYHKRSDEYKPKLRITSAIFDSTGNLVDGNAARLFWFYSLLVSHGQLKDFTSQGSIL